MRKATTKGASAEVQLDRLQARLKARTSFLSPLQVRITKYLIAHRLDVLTKTAVDLARDIGTSDASVIRTVKALGFSGLPDLKREMASVLGHGQTPLDVMRRTLAELGEDSANPFEHVFATHVEGLAGLGDKQTVAALEAAVGLLHAAQRIVVFGIGPTASITDYFASLLRRAGCRVHLLNATGIALADQLLDLAKGDVVVMLAYGQTYSEAATTIARAHRLKIPIILISDSPDNRLKQAAKLVIPVMRGRSGRVALHGATVVCLEALTIALAQRKKDQAVSALDLLNRLRKDIRRE